jgi:cytochrome c-type biogenesis protein
MPLFFLALAAGAVTIAGPCILPLLPIILGTATVKSHPSRPLFIVLGFIISFSVFVVLFSFLGRIIPVSSIVLRDTAAVLIGLFGTLMLFPSLQEKAMARISIWTSKIAPRAPTAEAGPGSGFLLGASLGLVWTPCAGPVLGTVLTLVAADRNLPQAISLLAAYAVGAGLPMLAIAYGGSAAVKRVHALAGYATLIQRIFGAIIIVTAIGIFLGYDAAIQTWLLEHYPWLFPNRLVNL